MKETDSVIFTALFKAAYEKCFGQPIRAAIGETEGKLFANQLFDKTGLTVGWRSLKNFSIFIMGTRGNRQENPSISTLDTLARYVLGAPYTNEITRKEEEGHHPYWFLYRERQLQEAKSETEYYALGKFKWFTLRYLIVTIFLLAIAAIISIRYLTKKSGVFIENFQNNGERQLSFRGWNINNKDEPYWAKANQHAGALTLFTLNGDSWPDSEATNPKIKNLLIRSLHFSCFTAELHIVNFIPAAEWQQTGLLLLQDTSLKGPYIRLSLAYNDNFGGYHRPAEIVTQAIYSTGSGFKPEEFAHYPVLTLDSAARIPSLINNLKYTALRIERNGQHYRFLYSGGKSINTAFREIAIKDLPFEPLYIGIFAFKGNATKSVAIPVLITKFTLQEIKCDH